MKKQKPQPPGLVLRCGCEVTFRDGETPLCPRHGVQSVARTVRMPAPRFRGSATGPHVQSMDLGASTARFAGSDPGKDAA